MRRVLELPHPRDEGGSSTAVPSTSSRRLCTQVYHYAGVAYDRADPAFELAVLDSPKSFAKPQEEEPTTPATE